MNAKKHTKKSRTKAERMLSARSQLMNAGFLILILGVTIFVLFNSLYNPDQPIDLSLLWQGKPWYLLLGVAFLFLSVCCEAVNLKMISHKVGFPRSFKQGVVYASSDVYFSSITPSASGGQPAAAYYMAKDGLPVSLASASLLLNVTIYTVSLILMSLFALLLRPRFFLDFSVGEKVCVFFGVFFHVALIIICFLCMFSKRLVLVLGNALISLGAKMHFVKDPTKTKGNFARALKNYHQALKIIRGDWKLVLSLIFFSCMQRLLLIPITYFVFLAIGIHQPFWDVFAMQMFCTVGSSAIPLPGAVGISETLYLKIFDTFTPNSGLCMLSMLLSRFISSYLAIITCGTVTITHHIRMKRRGAKASAETDSHDESDETVHDGLSEKVLPCPAEFTEQTEEREETTAAC